MDARADSLEREARGARCAIARAWLGVEAPSRLGIEAPSRLGIETPSSPSIVLGSITLRPHQVEGVARIRAAIAEYGGALLADETGLGKTYIAIALIAEAKQPIIIAPSALLPMWRTALSQASVTSRLHSTEALSRGRVPARGDLRADLIVVDEAHHFRNPKTKRYAALADLVTQSNVLLLSATPVHNQSADLASLLALFRANPPLGRVIIRREHTSATTSSTTTTSATSATRPHITPLAWIATADDEATLHDIVALPPPVPPRDGEAAAALVAHGLLRQWASSTGALRAALKRRLARATAMAATLETNRVPTYRDLRAWCLGEGAIQLAFPELLIPESPPDARDLKAAVEAHAQGVRALLARMAARPDPDLARAAALREISAGRKTVAFSAYEDTVHAMARHLRDRRVCALSASGGIVAGGRLRRAEALARFAPIASGSPPPAAACAIDLLIATDLLSEGLNLQDASVVVHLDLPWTPARMAQRVGRAARIGSPHECVSVYALAPPASSETMLGVERRLEEKLQQAVRAIGFDIRTTLERWAATDAPSARLGAVRSQHESFAAAVRVGDAVLLVADLGEGVTDDPDALAKVMASAEGEAVAAQPMARDRAEQAILAWAEARDLRSVRSTNVARRIAGIVSRARAHRRPAVALMAARARRASVLPLGAGAARLLDRLADADMEDETWLAEMAEFAETFEGTPRPAGIEILAMLLFHR